MQLSSTTLENKNREQSLSSVKQRTELSQVTGKNKVMKTLTECKAFPCSLVFYTNCKHPRIAWLLIINNDERFSFQAVYVTETLANNFAPVYYTCIFPLKF